MRSKIIIASKNPIKIKSTKLGFQRVFAHMDFAKHKPRMEHFWNFVLFDEGGYTTNVTDVHAAMPLKKQHFDRWILLFNQTLDSHFAGDNTQKAKQRATLVAWTIGSKMD